MRDGRAADNARRATPEFRAKRRAAYAAARPDRPDPPPDDPSPEKPPEKPRSLPRFALPRFGDRPFVGIDGEGAGTDDTYRMDQSGQLISPGRQLYMLLRAGDRELYTGRPLSTRDCFEFLTSLPRGPIYVGFSIGYDITMMLRDMPKDRLDRLLNERGLGRTTWTFYQGFAISWLAKNHLMIGRTQRVRTPEGRMWESIVPRSVRTFYEVFGFFQKSFLKVLHEFDIGTPAERELIERNKAARGGFAGDGLTDDMFCPFLTQTERDYCATEVRFLAELMEKFRDNCEAADIRPRTWNGAGKLSAALHRTHETITAARVSETVPEAVRTLASRAYYGGRFETTRHGAVRGTDGPLYEYDIRSAYPAEMTKLPCLEHGTWRELSPHGLRQLPDDALFIAPVRFTHKLPLGGHMNLCGLPVRQKDGRIYWPMAGNGVYWSTEMRAAARLGCRVSFAAPGWVYERRCDCHPFDWLDALYRYRQSLGGSLQGYPIKLGINGTYGKLVQRVGNPKWSNLVWGGLITGGTRARLMEAAAHNPEAVVMLATDGLFSHAPLPVPIGAELGQWEVSRHERLLIVQPGVYFGGARPKTRGVSPGFFHRADATGEPYTERFERAWAAYREEETAAVRRFPGPGMPAVRMPVRLFVGTKLAYARGKLETAGKWVETERQFSFDWTRKRGPALAWEGDAGWSYPQAGAVNLVNYPHAGDADLLAEMELAHAELDDQPDYIDLSPVAD